jgi:SAM-dependent methyltransferase
VKLLDIVRRQSIPQPWGEGEKIPWNDPDFSRRMLKEHLSQEYDAASRRFQIIDNHVRWIHEQVLRGNPTQVLDLGCGPGLYTSRLAKLGHSCVGIDFSPASVAYARGQADEERLQCKYMEQDIRAVDYGSGYGLVMLIFGEFNVFRPVEAMRILEKAHDALVPNGLILLEPHTFEAIRRMGEQLPSWYSAEEGLFSRGPHLCLQENFWYAKSRVAIERYYVIDAVAGEVTRHSASIQAYTDEQYRSMLVRCGFGEVFFYSSLDGSMDEARDDLIVILAQKRLGDS